MEQNYVSTFIFKNYIKTMNVLIHEYDARFSDFEERCIKIHLAFEPHLLDIFSAHGDFKIEAISFIGR